MAKRGEVLVAILNNKPDWEHVRDEHWYRIPVANATKWLGSRWPPQWVAFYYTSAFGRQKWSIIDYAQVLSIRKVLRHELLPDEVEHKRADQLYYQLMLGPLQQLPQPILSRRQRRVVFIPTTWEKFVNAAEINDLYDESPLEDRLWAELKRRQIPAERQEYVPVNGGRSYLLDFAFHCARGKLNVETDGDAWHGDRKRIPLDNLRDNDLETEGWKLLRFSTQYINERMTDYCIPAILENIQSLGGIEDGSFVPRRYSLDAPDGAYQHGLFDEPE
jgi:very-short-patch-repair endonuclease